MEATPVPRYRIEQYELHAQAYEVEAESPGEAVKKVLNGEADAVDNDYIEVAEDYGISVEDQLQEELWKSLVQHEVIHPSDHMVPSIRSIEELP